MLSYAFVDLSQSQSEVQKRLERAIQGSVGSVAVVGPLTALSQVWACFSRVIGWVTDSINTFVVSIATQNHIIIIIVVHVGTCREK